MRTAVACSICWAGALAFCLVSSPARAEEPDRGLALIVGAASNLAGIVIGGTVIAAARANDGTRNAGWLTIEGGFTVAPFAAHAAAGEWGFGAAFAAVPAAAFGGTAALFNAVPDAIDQGSIEQQRLMWGLFVAGQAVSVLGVLDAALAPWRKQKIAVVPTIGTDRAGVQIGGIF